MFSRFTVMKKIDTTTWLTQKALAKELKVPIQNVHNWVQRGKIKTMEYEFMPGTKIILVDRYSIAVDSQRFGRYSKK